MYRCPMYTTQCDKVITDKIMHNSVKNFRSYETEKGLLSMLPCEVGVVEMDRLKIETKPRSSKAVSKLNSALAAVALSVAPNVELRVRRGRPPSFS
mmetsp:Transcript_16382/g.37672  ORF Transcript_16382/g.37672 Transcript_16382/m.37672 type:complete len:96 (+) Transcript_16382:240-527(+)